MRTNDDDLEIQTQAEFEVEKINPLFIESMERHRLPGNLKKFVLELIKNSFIAGARWGAAKELENRRERNRR